ncbi:hypothetical protein HAX54_003617, partial [Datura stramonium]|nr:hypothetical protein [Datura stramonium]
ICDEHNAHLENKALDNGAYLSLQNPLHEEIVKCLWQFVLRKKVQKEKAKKRLKENRDRMNNVDDIRNINIVGDNEEHSRKKNNVPTSTEKKNNNIHKAANEVILNEKYKSKRKRGRKVTNQGEIQNNANKIVTRKCYTVWTMDLHNKFMEAVDQL